MTTASSLALPAAAPAAALPRLTVIMNEQAGSVAADARAALEAACARARLNVAIVAVRGEAIRAAAERAAGAGDVLIAAGGDGTVSTVAGVAVKTGAAFGVIPLGTLNHFARDAGIPLEVEAAVATIAGGRTMPLDSAALNGRTFVNNASVGIYARVVRERQLQQQRGRGKWTAFALGLVRALRSYAQVTVRMTVDGTPLVRRTPFVFVGNGEYVDEGLSLGRRTSLTGGYLWVSLAPECTRAQMFVLAVRAIAGRLTPDVPLERFRAAQVTIEPRGRSVRVALDGELASARPPFTFAIRPASLRTLLPAPPA